jgi:restriction endonuclease S subunit
VEYFVTYLKNIEGRIDPHYYRPSYRQLGKRWAGIKQSQLGELISLSNEIWNQASLYETSFPYIEINDIDVSTGYIVNISYYETAHAPSRARMIVRENDIILSTTRPHRGAIALIDKAKDGFIASTGFAVLRELKNKSVSKEYLYHILRTSLCLHQLIQRSSGGNYPAITTEELKKIVIPIPDSLIQQEVISLMESAYQLKRQKESEAQKLFDSINDYLLKELGINIHYEPQLTFVIYSNQVKERLDSLYYSQDVYYFLSGYKGNTTKVGDCIEYAQSGFAAGYNSQDTDSNGIMQIRPTNISDDRRMIFDRNIYVKQEAAEKQPGDILVKGEVLFNNTNSQELVGKSVVFNLDGQYFCSNHITRIKVKESALVNDYLAAILNLYQRRGVFYRICTNWNNQSGVNIELLKTVRIPLPTPEVQRGISSEIRSRVSQADELEQQGKIEFEKAKAEVERLILGR